MTSPRRLSERMRDAVDFGPVKYGHAAYVGKLMVLVAEVVALEAQVAELRKDAVDDKNLIKRFGDMANTQLLRAEAAEKERDMFKFNIKILDCNLGMAVKRESDANDKIRELEAQLKLSNAQKEVEHDNYVKFRDKFFELEFSLAAARKLPQIAYDNQVNIVRLVCHNAVGAILRGESLQNVVIFHLNLMKDELEKALGVGVAQSQNCIKGELKK